jgi:hypothetical protein
MSVPTSGSTPSRFDCMSHYDQAAVAARGFGSPRRCARPGARRGLSSPSPSPPRSCPGGFCASRLAISTACGASNKGHARRNRGRKRATTSFRSGGTNRASPSGACRVIKRALNWNGSAPPARGALHGWCCLTSGRLAQPAPERFGEAGALRKMRYGAGENYIGVFGRDGDAGLSCTVIVTL